MSNSRKLAVKALLKVENDAAYSNLILNSIFAENETTKEEKSLTAAIFYGVLDRKITLDYVISSFVKTPIKKIAPYTLQVLRSALYQIMYMDKIPDSAAVNEAVNLIKKSRESRNQGFVNGVLRNVIRSDFTLPEGDTATALSIRYSCPEWIIKSFTADYGIHDAKQLLEESLKPAPVIVRVNTIKIDKKTLISEFQKEDIPCSECEISNALILNKGFDAPNCSLYKKGYFYAEDTASQIAIDQFNAMPGERILDMCASPGGKSFTMAQNMKNCGEIFSCDLYEKRVGIIVKSAKRLGISIINPTTQDAEIYNFSLGKFDKILCDVPCSGLGVIRRKPDIKYKKVERLDELSKIQYNILLNAANYLKQDGKILYSTCTLRKDENENIINRFLSEHKCFYKMYEHTFMPHIDRTDGFYCALLKKSGS